MLLNNPAPLRLKFQHHARNRRQRDLSITRPEPRLLAVFRVRVPPLATAIGAAVAEWRDPRRAHVRTHRHDRYFIDFRNTICVHPFGSGVFRHRAVKAWLRSSSTIIGTANSFWNMRGNRASITSPTMSVFSGQPSARSGSGGGGRSSVASSRAAAQRSMSSLACSRLTRLSARRIRRSVVIFIVPIPRTPTQRVHRPAHPLHMTPLTRTPRTTIPLPRTTHAQTRPPTQLPCFDLFWRHIDHFFWGQLWGGGTRGPLSRSGSRPNAPSRARLSDRVGGRSVGGDGRGSARLGVVPAARVGVASCKWA